VSAPSAADHRPLIVGLTGGVASGKSYVSALFEELGVPLLDADQVAREVVEPGTPALAAIARRFGPDYLLADGRLDRRRLRQRVFADRQARRALEAITHPPIRSRIAEWIARQRAPYAMLSAAILLESGLEALVDRVLVIDAPPATQIQRLIARDGVEPQLARQMLAAQMDRALRLARADDVLDNGDERRELRPAVRALHRRYLSLAPARRQPPVRAQRRPSPRAR
jgi:dephospho-CoA kinase